jgi:hypothetical protein
MIAQKAECICAEKGWKYFFICIILVYHDGFVYLCISTCVGEIVEQLQLLVEFAPQWISARPSSTGEHIYR